MAAGWPVAMSRGVASGLIYIHTGAHVLEAGACRRSAPSERWMSNVT